ncbi:MAG: response regulator transcription factor, partial [Spirochaetales bacterium]|nr:response regulator transcription factor [Spirochaetales bacterium]
VLVVDDDLAIRKLLSKVLQTSGFEPVLAKNGEEALELVSKDTFQLILLDVTMPGLDGFQVIQRIRRKNITTPIMVVSGRSEDFDALYGLEIGADDYIIKPFNPIVLGAKVKALIRRNQIVDSKDESDALVVGPFTLDSKLMKVFKNKEEIILSQKEFQLMKLFMENCDMVFSKESLYNQVWGNSIIDENAIMVYISHLRNKIEDNPKEPQYISTVWGLGYSFSVNAEHKTEITYE